MYVSKPLCSCRCDFASSLHSQCTIAIAFKPLLIVRRIDDFYEWTRKELEKTLFYSVSIYLSIYASIRLECNFEDIDISRFQLWLLMLRLWQYLKLDLMFSYSILLSLFGKSFFLFRLQRDMNFSDFLQKMWMEKKDEECSICSRACKPKKNVSSFTSFFYWKIYKWIGAWCQLVLSLVHGVCLCLRCCWFLFLAVLKWTCICRYYATVVTVSVPLCIYAASNAIANISFLFVSFPILKIMIALGSICARWIRGWIIFYKRGEKKS